MNSLNSIHTFRERERERTENSSSGSRQLVANSRRRSRHWLEGFQLNQQQWMTQVSSNANRAADQLAWIRMDAEVHGARKPAVRYEQNNNEIKKWNYNISTISTKLELTINYWLRTWHGSNIGMAVMNYFLTSYIMVTAWMRVDGEAKRMGLLRWTHQSQRTEHSDEGIVCGACCLRKQL